MPASHRDLPPGSQQWANEMDALREEVAALQTLVKRLAMDARIDPSDPYKNINADGDAPAAKSPVQTRLTALADVQAYNVADKQVLTWSQADQAFVPQSPSGSDFVPDPSVTDWGAAETTTAHGTGAAETSASSGDYAWWGWTGAGHLDAECNDRSYRDKLSMSGPDIFLNTQNIGTGAVTGLDIHQLTGQVLFDGQSIGLPQCSTSSRPPTVYPGYCAVAYDTTVGKVILNTGSGWAELGGGVSTFTPPGSAPFSFYGVDPEAIGHDTGGSGQYGFVATSDSEAYLAANDPAYGDANVYLGTASVTIQSDAPGASSDWNMYSEIVTAKDGITMRSTQGNGTGAGGSITAACNWFVLPTFGVSTRPSASGHAGAVYFDIGLNKPGFSDGTDWRDAAGTII